MKKNKGFTIVELLAVIIIIALLSGLLIPAVSSARKKANLKTYETKVASIENSAIIYAQNNYKNLVKGTTENIVTKEIEVATLIGDYIVPDGKEKDHMVIDPRDNSKSLDKNKIIITINKKTKKITAEYIENDENTIIQPPENDEPPIIQTPSFTFEKINLEPNENDLSVSTTFTYNGDGTISCTTSLNTTCTVNTDTNTITITRSSTNIDGTDTINIKSNATSSYNELNKAITVKWKKPVQTAILTIPSTINGSYGSTTTTTSYSYNGDGQVVCTPISEGLTCSVDELNKTVTFIRSDVNNYTTFTATISASATANYTPISNNINIVWVRCFDEETLVAVWDRKKKKKLKKKIKDIKPGDIVYSYDPTTDSYVTSKVKSVSINKTKELFHIIFDDDEIVVTGDHPFFVNGIGYVNSELLIPGNEIVSESGIKVIKEIKPEYLNQDKDMYSIELEKGTSVIVGESGIVTLSMYASVLMASMYALNPELVNASIKPSLMVVYAID